jgi:hypothetical protein
MNIIIVIVIVIVATVAIDVGGVDIVVIACNDVRALVLDGAFMYVAVVISVISICFGAIYIEWCTFVVPPLRRVLLLLFVPLVWLMLLWPFQLLLLLL